MEDKNISKSFSAELVRHQESLYHHALRLCRCPDAAADLVQETLLRALAHPGYFKEGSNMKAWLHSILSNIFCNDYRRKSTFREICENHAVLERWFSSSTIRAAMGMRDIS